MFGNHLSNSNGMVRIWFSCHSLVWPWWVCLWSLSDISDKRKCRQLHQGISMLTDGSAPDNRCPLSCAHPDATFSLSGRTTFMSQCTELQVWSFCGSAVICQRWVTHIAPVQIVVKSTTELKTQTNGVGWHLFSNNNYMMDVEWMATPTSRKGTERRSPAKLPQVKKQYSNTMRPPSAWRKLLLCRALHAWRKFWLHVFGQQYCSLSSAALFPPFLCNTMCENSEEWSRSEEEQNPNMWNWVLSLITDYFTGPWIQNCFGDEELARTSLTCRYAVDWLRAELYALWLSPLLIGWCRLLGLCGEHVLALSEYGAIGLWRHMNVLASGNFDFRETVCVSTGQ